MRPVRTAETWNSDTFWINGYKDYAIEVDPDKGTVTSVRSRSQCCRYRHLI